MQLRYLFLQLPRSLFLLSESLHVLLLLAAYYHADFHDIVVDLAVALVLFELLQEEEDALLVKLLVEGAFVDLSELEGTSMTDLCFYSRMD